MTIRWTCLLTIRTIFTGFTVYIEKCVLTYYLYFIYFTLFIYWKKSCKNNIIQTYVTQWTSEAYWTCTAIIFRAHQQSSTYFISMHRTSTITISSIKIWSTSWKVFYFLIIFIFMCMIKICSAAWINRLLTEYYYRVNNLWFTTFKNIGIY